jgi:hypothetical protein
MSAPACDGFKIRANKPGHEDSCGRVLVGSLAR